MPALTQLNLIIIITSGVVISLLLIFGIVLFIRNRNKKQNSVQSVQKAQRFRRSVSRRHAVVLNVQQSQLQEQEMQNQDTESNEEEVPQSTFEEDRLEKELIKDLDEIEQHESSTRGVFIAPALINDENACSICYQKTSNVEFLPCNHMCTCKRCAWRVLRFSPKCPLCRSKITDFKVDNSIVDQTSQSMQNLIKKKSIKTKVVQIDPVMIKVQ